MRAPTVIPISILVSLAAAGANAAGAAAVQPGLYLCPGERWSVQTCEANCLVAFLDAPRRSDNLTPRMNMSYATIEPKLRACRLLQAYSPDHPPPPLDTGAAPAAAVARANTGAPVAKTPGASTPAAPFAATGGAPLAQSLIDALSGTTRAAQPAQPPRTASGSAPVAQAAGVARPVYKPATTPSPPSAVGMATAGYSRGTPASGATAGYESGTPASLSTAGYSGGTPASGATAGYSGGTACSFATAGLC